MAPDKRKIKPVQEIDVQSGSSSHGNRRGSFFFRLLRISEHWALTLVDARGNALEPDFRRFTGIQRLALREFSASLNQDTILFSWGLNALDPEFQVVYDPRPHLIELALATSQTVDADFQPLTFAEGIFRLFLLVEETTNSGVSITVGLEAQDGSPMGTEEKSKSKEKSKVLAISSQQVLWGTQIYTVADMGPLWKDIQALGAKIKREDLPVYLSIAVSRFPSLEIRYKNYYQRIVGTLETQNALIFKEIDPYGYLHIRPVPTVEGYPPLFFEEKDIIKVVELDEDSRTIAVAEVLFPVDPVDQFKTVLAKLGKDAQTGVYEEQGYFILAPEFAARFITEHIGELVDTFVLLESQLLRSYKISVFKPLVQFDFGSGIDFLKGTARVDIDGQEFSYASLLNKYKKEGFLRLQDGTKAYPLPRELQRLQRLINVRSESGVEVSFFDVPVLTDLRSISATGAAWKRALQFFQGINQVSQRNAEYPIEGGTLRPYQVYGVQWLEHLSEHGLGGCLADDMGLGKTIQVIALLRGAYRRGLKEPSLILIPRSLIYNWTAELRRFAPELRVQVFYGSQRDSQQLRAPETQVVLSTYATARIDQKEFVSIPWHYLIIDESQTIKNSEAKTSHAVFSLKAAHKIALSGTPMENNLGELYSLFNFLNPSLFGKKSEFMKAYLSPIQEQRDSQVIRELKLKIYPFILRRLKQDVLSELPAKTEQTVLIELDQDHFTLYERRRRELQEKIQISFIQEGFPKTIFKVFQALTELRRLAGVPETEGEYGGVSAKREYLMEMVENLVAEGHKCLIFTNHLATVDLLSQDLGNRNIGNLIMTGATVDRQALVQRFQTDDSIKAFVMTLKTGGVGLNLTAADYVFIFDPWWNQSAEAQAVDRIHRIGQTKPVFSYRLIAKDTIEERILELQEKKVDLIQSVLVSDSDLAKSLTPEDIDFLLGSRK